MIIMLGQWAVLMLLVSSLLWLVSVVIQRRARSTSTWPAFWSALLSLCLIIPSLTVLLNLFPNANPAQHLPLPDLLLISSTVATTFAQPHTESSRLDWALVLSILGAIHLGGVLLGLVRLLTGRLRVASIIRHSEAMSLRGNTVWVSPSVPTAFACASLWRWRSWIVLPQAYLDQMSRTAVDTVIKHEQAHLDRGDDRWGMCWRIVQCLCWSSPSVRPFFQGWVLSTELRCDQVVVGQQPASARRAYAQSVVQAHCIAANRVLSYPAASFSPHQPWSESMRIKHILSGKRLQSKTRGANLRLLALASVTALTASMALSVHADSSSGTSPTESQTPFSQWIPGKVSSEYGMRPFGSTNKSLKKFHKGIDIATAEGSVIRMPKDGVVVIATDLYQNTPAYGKVVIIETADQTRTLLAHLSEYSVREGQQVTEGMPIAKTGSTGQVTGPHAHIETWVGEARVNPREVW